MKSRSLVAIIEPPSEEDSHWVVSAAAIHYQAQGRTRGETIRLFEKGLPEAIAWAKENGVNIQRVRQPEVLEFEM